MVSWRRESIRASARTGWRTAYLVECNHSIPAASLSVNPERRPKSDTKNRGTQELTLFATYTAHAAEVDVLQATGDGRSLRLGHVAFRAFPLPAETQHSPGR